MFYPLYSGIMEPFRTEGIILHALNFRDFDQILTVYSQNQGLIKFILKGGNSAKRRKGSSSAPLTRAEFVYMKGRSDLLNLHEISVLDYQTGVRESLDHLEAACGVLQAVQSSQFPEKPAPTLYQLLVSYLAKIPQAKSPASLVASFRLKIMRHDGLYGLDEYCSSCQTPLKTFHICDGESFCSQHAPGYALLFSEQEAKVTTYLAYCRSLADLDEVPITQELSKKIQQMFQMQNA